MASRDQICDELVQFIGSRIPDDEPVAADTDLLETELLDSLLIMDLVAHIEKTFGVKLENADIAPRHFRTPATLAQLVAERQS